MPMIRFADDEDEKTTTKGEEVGTCAWIEAVIEDEQREPAKLLIEVVLICWKLEGQ